MKKILLVASLVLFILVLIQNKKDIIRISDPSIHMADSEPYQMKKLLFISGMFLILMILVQYEKDPINEDDQFLDLAGTAFENSNNPRVLSAGYFVQPDIELYSQIMNTPDVIVGLNYISTASSVSSPIDTKESVILPVNNLYPPLHTSSYYTWTVMRMEFENRSGRHKSRNLEGLLYAENVFSPVQFIILPPPFQSTV